MSRHTFEYGLADVFVFGDRPNCKYISAMGSNCIKRLPVLELLPTFQQHCFVETAFERRHDELQVLDSTTSSNTSAEHGSYQ